MKKFKFIGKLSHETIQILNFKAQKATAKYGGRKWTAWFCQEIPIPNGPYKFGGLPGLIVKSKMILKVTSGK